MPKLMKTKTKGIFLGNFESALLTKVKLMLGVVQKLRWQDFWMFYNLHYKCLQGTHRFSLEYLWKRAARITMNSYSPQRERLFKFVENPVKLRGKPYDNYKHWKQMCERCSANYLRPISYFGSIWELGICFRPKNQSFL